MTDSSRMRVQCQMRLTDYSLLYLGSEPRGQRKTWVLCVTEVCGSSFSVLGGLHIPFILIIWWMLNASEYIL